MRSLSLSDGSPLYSRLACRLEIQIGIDPGALFQLPRGNLCEGEDAEVMQCTLDLLPDAGNELQVVNGRGARDAGRTVLVFQRRLAGRSNRLPGYIAAFGARVARRLGVGGGFRLGGCRRLQLGIGLDGIGGRLCGIRGGGERLTLSTRSAFLARLVVFLATGSELVEAGERRRLRRRRDAGRPGGLA
jgi:hypothetical protein